jgi:hypothetical protein
MTAIAIATALIGAAWYRTIPFIKGLLAPVISTHPPRPIFNFGSFGRHHYMLG